MKQAIKQAIFTIFVFLLSVSAVFAASASNLKTFVVLPFTVNGPAGYKYLEQSIPSMFSSRLYWEGNFAEPVKESPLIKKTASDEKTAGEARASVDADYVIWGSVTIVGEDASLDVRVMDKSGKVWPKAREIRVAQLIPAVKTICDSISTEVFKRPTQSGGAVAIKPDASARVNQMNPELMHNEDTPKTVYLNPNLNYSGGSEGDESIIRTQHLPFSSTGMEICDADGDGRNEIFIMAEYDIYAYHFENGRLVPLGEFSLSRTSRPLSIRSMDMDRSGKSKLIVNSIDNSEGPDVKILTFDGKNFNVESKIRNYYLNVINTPPTYTPTLIGQASYPPRFLVPNVFEMHKNNTTFDEGVRLTLPEFGNVFNFSYLPSGAGREDSAKLIMLNRLEKLQVYTDKGSRLAETEEKFSGSSRGIEINSSMPGMGKDPVNLADIYYIPLRMLSKDLDGDGNYELIVNHPISTASELFPRYRSYPQSEIHSLYWDGSGLNLQWKTRRIKATVVDFTVADINNDGSTALVVCVNTHPGAVGMKSIKTMLFVYPLDLSKN